MPFADVPEITTKFVGQPYDLNSVMGPDEVWAYLDAAPELVRQALIALIANLNSNTLGQSGAESVGSPTISGLDGNTVYAQIVSLLEVAISAQQGTILPGAITDTMLSGLTDQIKDRFTKHVADNSKHPPYAVTTHSGNNYSVTITGMSSLNDGDLIRVKFDAASTGAITINPSGIGPKSVVDYFGNAITNVRTGLISNLCYDATSGNFILLGKGGGGNAVAGQLLKDATATVDSGPITGTMPDYGLTAQASSGTAISGTRLFFTSGVTGRFTAYQTSLYASDDNFISDNIKKDTSVFGLVGKSTVVDVSDTTIDTTHHVLSGLSFYGSDGNKYTGDMPNLLGVRNPTGTSKWPDGSLAVYPEPGYQKGGVGDGEIKVTPAQLQSSEPNLVPENILYGKSIFGIPGSADPPLVAGDTIWISLAAQETIDTSSLSNYFRSKSITIQTQGTIRVKFEMYHTAYQSFGSVRVDGVEKYNAYNGTNNVWESFSCDVTLLKGSTVELWVMNNGTGVVTQVRNFSISLNGPAPNMLYTINDY